MGLNHTRESLRIMYVSALHSGVKKFGMAGLVILVFTMPGMSAKSSHNPIRSIELSAPVAIERAGAPHTGIPEMARSGSAVRTSPGENILPTGLSKSVTIVAGVLFLLPFAASSFQVLRRNRTV
jgi:hypothetical protein